MIRNLFYLVINLAHFVVEYHLSILIVKKEFSLVRLHQEQEDLGFVLIVINIKVKCVKNIIVFIANTLLTSLLSNLEIRKLFKCLNKLEK